MLSCAFNHIFSRHFNTATISSCNTSIKLAQSKYFLHDLFYIFVVSNDHIRLCRINTLRMNPSRCRPHSDQVVTTGTPANDNHEATSQPKENCAIRTQICEEQRRAVRTAEVNRPQRFLQELHHFSNRLMLMHTTTTGISAFNPLLRKNAPSPGQHRPPMHNHYISNMHYHYD